jgi:hypothetical protein
MSTDEEAGQIVQEENKYAFPGIERPCYDIIQATHSTH